jgi:sulfane dehydrogenase subunit SoxC
MSTDKTDRRRFLKNGAALAGVGVGAAILPANAQTVSDPAGLRAYGQRSHFATSIRIPAEDRPYIGPDGGQRMTPLQDSVGIITPNSLHFISTHGYDPPDIDPKEHRLMIHGMVDRPLIFTLEEVKRLPSVTRVHFIECAGNSALRHLKQRKRYLTRADFDRPGSIQGLHGETSCSEWTGVELSLLLQQAGVQKGASWVIAEGVGADESKGRHMKSIPLEKAMDDALVVYGQNGEDVRPDNGYPLRLLVPGFEGVSNVKWLRRLKVVDGPYMTYDETTGYIAHMPILKGKSRWFQFQVGPKSLITYPSDAHQLSSPGFYEISGLAWSGAGAVRRVEVSTDGGRTWTDAKLQEPVHRKSYTRFRSDWNWNGEEVVIQSRCTDELGQVQPNLDEKAKEWGVEPNWFLTPESSSTHMNTIQPWRIDRDGGIHNAMFA